MPQNKNKKRWPSTTGTGGSCQLATLPSFRIYINQFYAKSPPERLILEYTYPKAIIRGHHETKEQLIHLRTFRTLALRRRMELREPLRWITSYRAADDLLICRGPSTDTARWRADPMLLLDAMTDCRLRLCRDTGIWPPTLPTLLGEDMTLSHEIALFPTTTRLERLL